MSQKHLFIRATTLDEDKNVQYVRYLAFCSQICFGALYISTYTELFFICTLLPTLSQICWRALKCAKVLLLDICWVARYFALCSQICLGALYISTYSALFPICTLLPTVPQICRRALKCATVLLSDTCWVARYFAFCSVTCLRALYLARYNGLLLISTFIVCCKSVGVNDSA